MMGTGLKDIAEMSRIAREALGYSKVLLSAWSNAWGRASMWLAFSGVLVIVVAMLEPWLGMAIAVVYAVMMWRSARSAHNEYQDVMRTFAGGTDADDD